MASTTENIAPQTMTRIIKELRQLVRSPPDGVKYVPQDDNVAEIHAELKGPAGTPYEGGTFRIKLVLGAEYPSAPPRGFFLTTIFHPNVSASGDICVNALKRDWKPEMTLGHILKIVWCLLVVPFPESSLNDEAGKLFMESYDEYARHARIITSIHAMGATATAGGAGAGDAAAPATATSVAAAKDAKKKKAKKKKTLKRL